MPYPMLAQTRLLGLPPFPQSSPREDLSLEARALGLPMAAPAPTSVSVPLNVPKEVTVNFHVNVKLEADPALAALALRVPAAAPPPAPAPAPAAPAPTPRPAPAEPAASSRGTVSPVLLVALCVLVSVSTVIALGPLGQAASSLALADLPRLSAPVFTLAALAVGYWWGRGRGGDRQK
jgi:hypothetical protein